MPTGDEAVRLLEELGLTKYEARCFVGLSRVRQATATDVSDVSDVPRSRVYDALDRLHERGLVDVQQSDPREYRAIPHDEALELLESEYAATADSARDAFDHLERADVQEETGAWAIADHDHVTDRVTSLVEEAEREVYLLVVDEDQVEDEVFDALADAADRGASVVVEVPSAEVREAVESAVPDATVRATAFAERSTAVEEKWLGRVAMVDRDSVLVSSVAAGVAPGITEETAIWATGADHGLVVGFRHLLRVRIDDPDTLGGSE